MNRSHGVLGVVAALALAGVAEGAGPVTNGSWSVVQALQAEVQPLVDAGNYRDAASAYHRAQTRTRDRTVKEYTRYAYDLFRLRDTIAKGRPGQTILALTFDDGEIPAVFRDGREVLSYESGRTFAGSPGSLRVRSSSPPYVLAEASQPFEVLPDTVITVCFFAHDIKAAKFQLNTEVGSIHYFWKGPVKQDAWNTMTFRLGLDGSQPLPSGTRVHGTAFVGEVATPEAYVILDEWYLIAHP